MGYEWLTAPTGANDHGYGCKDAPLAGNAYPVSHDPSRVLEFEELSFASLASFAVKLFFPFASFASLAVRLYRLMPPEDEG